ncbi:MAG TPA: cytochrome c3 family protein [Candidatus Methanoperedens sp.]|nr:cytochrome c3 family protein [Candidatus Methanoperedens sp.]
MKKGIIIALLAVFAVFAVGPAFAAIGADGKLTVNAPAAKWPAKKLNADGTKKKNPVTFNHTKHGALGCATCHHNDKDLKTGGTPAKLCFDCHGPAASADGKQPDTYEMIHGKTAMCLACHKTDAAAQAAKAPTACKDCHGGAE